MYDVLFFCESLAPRMRRMGASSHADTRAARPDAARGGFVQSGGAVSIHFPLVLPDVWRGQQNDRKWRGLCTERKHVFVLAAMWKCKHPK